jgi:ribosomal protein S18 acetylase RimI-like enzyme
VTVAPDPGALAEEALRIRIAGPSDLPRLVELINAAFVVESFIEGTRTDAARLAEQMKKGVILLAEQDEGQPFASVCPLASVYVEKRGNRGYVGMLAVAPERQGRGLGRRMMREAEAWLRREGCAGVDLTVLSLRTELPAIYRRFGYVETGTLPFKPDQRLKDGYECHCIVMSKEFLS